MEKLKKIRDGFNKIPQILIYFLVIIICAYATIPSLFMVNEYLDIFGMDLAEMLENPLFRWVSFFMGAVFSWGIIEIIISIIHNMSIKRQFLVQGQSASFKNSIRLGYIVTQLIIGSYNMLSFIPDEVVRLHFLVATDTVSLIVNCIVFTFVYLVLKKDVIRGDKVFTVFYMLFNVYTIFQAVSKVFQFGSAFFSSEVATMADKVYSAINLFLVIVACGLLYVFVYKKARQEQIKFIAEREVTIEIKYPGDDIFKGYDL